MSELIAEMVECVTCSESLSEVNDIVRQVMMICPDVDGVEFYLGDDGVYAEVPSYSELPDVVYDLADKLCQVQSIDDFLSRRDKFISTHKGTIPYLVGFIREMLGFHGIRKVFVFGIGEKLSVTFGPTSNGKPNPDGEKAVEAFLKRYITKYPDLPYQNLDSWNEKRKGISFGISIQR